MPYPNYYRNTYSPRRGSPRRRRQLFFQKLLRVLGILLLFLVLLFLLWKGGSFLLDRFGLPVPGKGAVSGQTAADSALDPGPAAGSDAGSEAGSELFAAGEGSTEFSDARTSLTDAAQPEDILAEASRMAAGYDYDSAIGLLRSCTAEDPEGKLASAITEYEANRAALRPVDLSRVTHVFFHPLIMDESKAFDGEYTEKGYNQVMTTREEFLKILQSMYDRGFVLVRLHDMAEEAEADGVTRMVKKEILLPEGKQAFVLSEDDVCYYDYMEGDGFASRMIIGEDGYPTCEMKLADGSTVTGSYDLVPILEDFIREHPDFSYRGARGVLAFTGYQGILGYRTASSYQETSPSYEEDRKAAAAVAACLREHGWELASHSWGHRDLGNIEYASFQSDCDKWEEEVESLIGPTDIILFPFGADVGTWHPYSEDNTRYQYLHELGFRYFCNVDSSQYWVQFGSDYLRQGRRNLDGYRMWRDIVSEEEGSSRKLEDLFHAEDVFSPNRPTPVEWN